MKQEQKFNLMFTLTTIGTWFLSMVTGLGMFFHWIFMENSFYISLSIALLTSAIMGHLFTILLNSTKQTRRK